MNISDKAIIDGLQKAASAETLAIDLKQDLKDGLFSLKESIRYDMQNIMNGNVKLMIKEALDEHYDNKGRPHIEVVSGNVGAVDKRVTTLESDKKAIKWVVLAVSGIVTTIYNFLKSYF